MGFNIVMTGYDHTVFEHSSNSNTEARLTGYAEILESYYPKSRITYLALRAPKNAKSFSRENIDFIPVHCNIISMFYKLPCAFSRIQNISMIFSQTPYEDGFISLIYSKFKNILFGVQIHNDPQNIPGSLPIRLFRQMMSLCCYSAAKIIRVVNPIIAHKLKSSYGDKVKNIPVAPSLIPALRSAIPTEPTILIVSRLSKEKGVDIALGVITKSTTQIPDLKTIIIGEGEEDVPLKLQAKQLGINIDFLGALSPNDLSKYYSAATLLLLTSREEGWGRVLIEAMMAGLPIVATETLGAQAIVRHNQNGFLHPVGDIENLSQSVVKLCSDRDLNHKMGYESYEMSGEYQSQKLDHELINAIVAINTGRA